MKKSINKIFLAGIMTTVVMVSCEKKLNVLDTNSPTQESYFKTAAELEKGVNGAYSILRSTQLLGRSWHYFHSMRGGEVNEGGPQLEGENRELLIQASPQPVNAQVNNIWTGVYQIINRANLVIAKAPGVTDNIALRDRVVGEAKFLRAWAYFELVSQWGDVPMYTEPVVSSTAFKGKEPADNIYTLIVNDLKEAATALPPSYSGDNLGRATKGAANALLGRVLMQKGDYGEAKTALLAVYNSNLYSLVPFLWNFDGDIKSNNINPAETGHEFNAESVFEVAFVDKGDNGFNWGPNGEGLTQPGSTMRAQDWGTIWGNVIPSNRLLDEFEDNDPRYKWTFWEEGDKVITKAGTLPGVTLTDDDMNVQTSTRKGVTIKRVFRKYSLNDWLKVDGIIPSGINYRLIRYADVLLMLAECEAEVGTPAQAAFYINKVRSRPGVNMPSVNPTTKNQALAAVMHERAVELAGECIDNIDILRWRKKGYFPSIKADPRPGQAEFLPIPSSEVSSNPMIQ